MEKLSTTPSESVWRPFLFHCNYDVKDIPITSQFYSELLKWWSDFREEFDTERDQQNIEWNNKEIRIDNKPVFYKMFLSLVSSM